MGFFSAISSVASGLVAPITEWVKGHQELKKIKTEGNLRIEKARIDATIARVQQASQSETDWDLEALRASQTSWKDEWFALLLSLPFIGSFIPVVQDYVAVGWENVSMSPLWYQASFIGAICASFGIRWYLKSAKLGK